MQDHRLRIHTAPWIFRKPHRFDGVSGGLALLSLALASCQSYEPRPLDPVAHIESWQARTLAGASLQSFLERLETLAADSASGIDSEAPFDASDGLELEEARKVALVFNPELRLARLRLARAAAGIEHADSWEDPALSLSVLHITESVPSPWVITPGLTFSIPISGRLGIEEQLLEAGERAARCAVIEAEWDLAHELARGWARWSAARLRVEETERLERALTGLTSRTSQLAELGEFTRAEASLFVVEHSQRGNELRRLRADVEAERQRLLARMGLAPGAPVELVPSLPNPKRRELAAGDADATKTACAEIEARNPSLARLRSEYEMSEQALRREIARQIPDLTLGPLFESDEGQSSIGLLGGVPIPILNANRRAIAEARMDREIARAQLEIRHEALVGRWAGAAARAEALGAQRSDFEEVLMPLVDAQLAGALQLMTLGEGNALVLLESLTRAHRSKLDWIETRLSEALVAAELAHLVGPPAHEAEGEREQAPTRTQVHAEKP